MSATLEQIKEVYGSDGSSIAVRRPVNVGPVERIMSAAAGALLAKHGLKQRSLAGLFAAAAGGALAYRGASGHCHVYEALGVNTARDRTSLPGVRAQQGAKCEKSLTIQRSAEELYRRWRRFEDLTQIMESIERIDPLDEKRSHWIAKGPNGVRLEWDAEVVNDEPNQLIAWRSLPGGDVDTAGSVHFEPAAGNRGTVVRVSLKYDPPGGKMTAKLADLFQSGLDRRLTEDLRRFKQVMEAGEAPTIAGQSHGEGDRA